MRGPDGHGAAAQTGPAGCVRQGRDFAPGERFRRAAADRRDSGSPPRRTSLSRSRRRPRVALIADRRRARPARRAARPGRIVSSNAHGLAALVRGAGGEPLVLPIAPATTRRLARPAAARGCDMLVTTGGAASAITIWCRRARPRGLRAGFLEIAMRPGKPLICGRLGHTPVLGLPGNPVSALVCGVAFLLPALQRP